jgi:hypothetical protein
MRICSFLLLFPIAVLLAQTPRRTLDGDVIDSVTGAPVASARVKLTAGNSDPIYRTADAQGRFQFDNLSAATYSLAVDHPGYLAPTGPLWIAAGQSTVHVPLVAGGVIYGAITDPNGLPAPLGEGCFVRLFEQRPINSGPAGAPGGQSLPDGKNELVVPAPYYAGFPDDRGLYRSNLLAPGTYYVAVTVGRDPSFWAPTWRSTYYPRAFDLASAKAIRLQAGQQVQADIQVISQPGIRVSGRVVIPPHDALPAGMQIFTNVHLRPSGGELLTKPTGNATVSADRFEMKALLPGKYTLMAETEQMSADGSGRNRKSLFGTQREVELGERDIADLDVELQPLTDVTGKVTFDQGCNTGPVPVHLSGGGMMGIQQYSAVSGADGTFAFGTFHPSPLSLSVGAPGMSTVFLGDRDITRTGFNYPAPPQPLRIVVHCSAGRAQ